MGIRYAPIAQQSGARVASCRPRSFNGRLFASTSDELELKLLPASNRERLSLVAVSVSRPDLMSPNVMQESSDSVCGNIFYANTSAPISQMHNFTYGLDDYRGFHKDQQMYATGIDDMACHLIAWGAVERNWTIEILIDISETHWNETHSTCAHRTDAISVHTDFDMQAPQYWCPSSQPSASPHSSGAQFTRVTRLAMPAGRIDLRYRTSGPTTHQYAIAVLEGKVMYHRE